MLSLDKILNTLNNIAPFELSCEWDNCGLLINAGKAVSKALVCLDVTEPVIKEAVAIKADLIITHHPVIFKPLKKLDYRNPAYLLCKEDISCIAMHTNLDAASGGVNDLLCEIIGVKNTICFEQVGRLGDIKSADVLELANIINGELNYKPRYYDAKKTINKVAIVGGAGSYITEAFNSGADCLITGELRHDDWLTAQGLGISAIEAGHYATEKPVIKSLCRQLKHVIGDSVEFVESNIEIEPNTLFNLGE